MAQHTNNYPKLHNSAWPCVVGVIATKALSLESPRR